MTLTLVRKRSGSIVEFDRGRIERAIEKAYQATGVALDAQKERWIVDTVIERVASKFSDERIPDVESIQDLVERTIAEIGDFAVTKAYILYRAERADIRFEKQQETLARINRAELKVKKRSGKIVPFELSQIEEMIRNITNGYEEIVPVPKILEGVKLNIFDGMTTAEINNALVMTMKSYIERDPQYAYIVARLLANDLYKDVIGVDEFSGHFQMVHTKMFPTYIANGIKEGRLDKRLADFDLGRLAAALKPERDRLFDYLGLQVLYDRYFVRDMKQKLMETPQYFWMRVAMGFAILESDPTAYALSFYETLSEMQYVPSTPTLLHSGTHRPQMSACFLLTAEDDLHHIFHTISNNAQLSKWSGGVANDWTNIRATNAQIKSINTGSQGVVPFLKIVDATTASINRSGKRRGATAVYLETWHYDIEDFLDLRKNVGDERRRTHDTNTVNWIPDLFMKRVAEGGQWTLFSPEEVPELHHIYGKAFEERYHHYEDMADQGKIAMFRRVKAEDLWRKMIMMIYETGHPWMTFKDPSNIRSPQDHVGVVHCSNLCTEITLNTSKDETAVCNIGSINLMRHVHDGKINYEQLAISVKQGIRMLENTIDINFYPIKEAAHSNALHRPIGLGIMGYQDVLFDIGMSFDSEEAVDLSDTLMEFISWHAIMSSSELAKEKGAYSSYKGSKWDRGIFPIDTIALLEEERGIPTGISKTGAMDWTPVREHVAKYGMRNSNTMAIAPTATISNISGCQPSFEPIYKNLYVKSNFSGEFTVINESLVKDLKKQNLWNKEILEKIKFHEGNIENIHEIPLSTRMKYKEVFQVDPAWSIQHAARRGKWIDQSQSFNLFMSTTSGRAISDAYMMAWKAGLKTTYYLRTLGATSIEKSSIDINKQYTSKPEEGQSTVSNVSPVALEHSKEPVPVRAKISLQVLEGEICESCQ